MNLSLMALGVLGLFGVLAHVVLGERFIVRRLGTDSLPTSFLGDGDVTKRYLRWFWHVGTLVIGGSSIALIILSSLKATPETRLLVRYIACQFLGVFGMFLLVAVPRPVVFLRIPQGSIMGVGGVLIWLLA